MEESKNNQGGSGEADVVVERMRVFEEAVRGAGWTWRRRWVRVVQRAVGEVIWAGDVRVAIHWRGFGGEDRGGSLPLRGELLHRFLL